MIKIILFSLFIISLINPVNGVNIEFNDTDLDGAGLRFADVLYTNDNNFPIIISIRFTSYEQDGAEIYFDINGSVSFHYFVDVLGVANTYHTGDIYRIIPAKANYEVRNLYDVFIDHWYEHNITDDIPIINNYYINQTLNVTNNNTFKAIIIKDDINIDYLTEYNYSIFLDGLYWKDIVKDEILLVPDNSDILIYIPAPINTDFSQAYDLSKPALIIVAGFLITFSIFVAVVIILFNYIFKRGRP